jgi:hypothetical protein
MDFNWQAYSSSQYAIVALGALALLFLVLFLIQRHNRVRDVSSLVIVSEYRAQELNKANHLTSRYEAARDDIDEVPGLSVVGKMVAKYLAHRATKIVDEDNDQGYEAAVAAAINLGYYVDDPEETDTSAFDRVKQLSEGCKDMESLHTALSALREKLDLDQEDKKLREEHLEREEYRQKDQEELRQRVLDNPDFRSDKV